MTRRTALLLVALVATLLPLAPGAPASAAPAKTFTTDEGSSEHDAAPGDGVCLTSLGGCSFQAALDEAIALRKGTIVVDVEGGAGPTSVRGSIVVRGESRTTDVSFSALRVERGATLVLQNAELVDAEVSPVVRGRLVLDRVVQLAGSTALRIDPSGSATLHNSLIVLDGPIHNLGSLLLSYSTLRVPPEARGIQTSAEGITRLVASHLYGDRSTGSRACGGTRPVSLGYSSAVDGSCGLTGPTDIGVLPPASEDELTPAADSPRVDAIPVGAVGCGTDVVEDYAGRPRPAEGNGDDTVGCDVGWIERQPGD